MTKLTGTPWLDHRWVVEGTDEITARRVSRIAAYTIRVVQIRWREGGLKYDKTIWMFDADTLILRSATSVSTQEFHGQVSIAFLGEEGVSYSST